MNCYSECLATTVITTTTQAANEICVIDCDENCESFIDSAEKYSCIVDCYDNCLTTTVTSTTPMVTTTTAMTTTTSISELDACYDTCDVSCDSEENDIAQHQCVMNCYSTCFSLPTTTAMTTQATTTVQTTKDPIVLCHDDCDIDCADEEDSIDQFQCQLSCYVGCVPTTIAPTTLDVITVCQRMGLPISGLKNKNQEPSDLFESI